MVCSNPVEVKQATHNYFASLFSKRSFVSISLENANFMSLMQEQASQLTILFTKSKILYGITSYGSSKVPSPDDFSFYSIRMLGICVQGFLQKRKVPKGINSSFMVLISTVVGTHSLSEFRPISLINGIYKMISKVLSFWLCLVLGSVIVKNQQKLLTAL